MNPLRRLAVLSAILLAQVAGAQEAETQRVQFPAGQSGTVIRNSISGFNSVEYLLGAQAGQRMVVEMSTSNPSAYFNIYAPGNAPGRSEAMFIAASSGLRYEGVLPSSGDYMVQVFINRNAARRDESASYQLDISIGGSGAQTAASQPDYADGLAGGPDYWEVFGVSNALKIRSAPSTNARVLIQFPRGTVVQNLGCQMNEGRRWCRITQPGGTGVTGWAAGQYLREAAAPSYVTSPSGSNNNAGAASSGAPLGMMPTWCRNEAATRYKLSADQIGVDPAIPIGNSYQVSGRWPVSNPTDHFICRFDASGAILDISPR